MDGVVSSGEVLEWRRTGHSGLLNPMWTGRRSFGAIVPRYTVSYCGSPPLRPTWTRQMIDSASSMR